MNKFCSFLKKLFFHLYIFDISPNHGDHPCQFMTRNQRILVDIFKISFSSFFMFSWLLIDFGLIPWKSPTSFQQNEHQCGRFHRISPCNLLLQSFFFVNLVYQICLHKILSSRNWSSINMEDECFIQTLHCQRQKGSKD